MESEALLCTFDARRACFLVLCLLYLSLSQIPKAESSEERPIL
jgi:hypothetical protein